MNEHRVVLVTGASSGFGMHGAKALAARGHRVVAAMRGVSSRNAKAAAELRAFEAPTPITVVDIDVTDTASVDRGVAEATATHGRLDAVIQNAGVMFLGPAEAFTPEQFARQLDINAVGTFRVARAVLPVMRRGGGGLIVNVSSVGGRITLPFAGLYNASKWAIESLTEALRLEVSTFGIECVLLEPGPFATNLMQSGEAPGDPSRLPEYGVLAEVQGAFMKGFEAIFTNPQVAPMIDPALVSQRFVDLVEADPGTRPFRSTVGLDLNIAKMNALTEPFRVEGLAQMGVGVLDKLPSQRGSSSN